MHEDFGAGGDEDELLELILADPDEPMARVVPADLLLFGEIMEDLFTGQIGRQGSPSAPLAPSMSRDLDAGFFRARGFLAEHLGLVEQAHLVRHGPLAARPEALALQQTNVLAQLGDLFVSFGDLCLMLLLLPKH